MPLIERQKLCFFYIPLDGTALPRHIRVLSIKYRKAGELKMSKPASTPPIKNSSIRSLKNKRGKLARKLAGEPTWVSGSFRQTTMYNKGYPDSGHPHQFISRRIDGRYKSTYVRKSQIEVAKRAVQRRRDIDTIT